VIAASILAAVAVMAAAVVVRRAARAGRTSRARRRVLAAVPRRPRTARPRFAVRLTSAPPAVAAAIAATGFGSVDVLWHGWLASSAVLSIAAGAVGGPVLACVALLLAAAALGFALVAFAGRRGRLIEDALPDVLEAVAGSLRSGASLVQALDEASATAGSTARPVGAADAVTDLRLVIDDVAAGEALSVALDRWPARRPLPGVRLAAAALALAADAGGPQARALDGVAATLRDRVAVARELDALASQAQLSAVVIAVAPIAFGAVAAAADPQTARFLLRSTAGTLCIAAGLFLDLVAAAWMARITAAARR
jgi:tight adherence protein B